MSGRPGTPSWPRWKTTDSNSIRLCPEWATQDTGQRVDRFRRHYSQASRSDNEDCTRDCPIQPRSQSRIQKAAILNHWQMYPETKPESGDMDKELANAEHIFNSRFDLIKLPSGCYEVGAQRRPQNGRRSPISISSKGFFRRTSITRRHTRTRSSTTSTSSTVEMSKNSLKDRRGKPFGHQRGQSFQAITLSESPAMIPLGR